MMYKTLFISLLDQKKNIAEYKLVKNISLQILENIHNRQ